MNEKADGDAHLFLAHHHPGRLRVRSRALERAPAALEAIELWLSQQAGVCTACVHAPTGSVLVTYDPTRTDAGELMVGIASRAHLTIAEPSPGGQPAQAAFDAFRALDEFVLDWSGGRWGLGVLVPLALGVSSVGSLLFSAHRRAPRWDNLLYWGVQLFRSLNEDEHPQRRASVKSGRDRGHASGI